MSPSSNGKTPDFNQDMGVQIPLVSWCFISNCLYGVIANIPAFQAGDVGAEPTIGSGSED